MQLHATCFKIDRPNAKAMIAGYRKNGELHRQCIWLAAKDLPFPALLTLQRTAPRFKLSEVGRRMHPQRFTLPLKYAATLVSEYFIENDMALWENVCSSGLFDIWTPGAPYKRFAQAKSSRADFRIQLVRIYEIDHEFQLRDIESASSRIDRLASPKRNVTPLAPVIPEEEFATLTALLECSVSSYLTQPPRRYSVACDIEEPPERVTAHISRVIRDTKKAVDLKRDYDFRCQVCGLQLPYAHDKYYIEVHHLRPLGGTHKGTDTRENMLVLCPNHHALFDLGVPRFLDPETIDINSERFRLKMRHKLAKANIAYYSTHVYKNAK